MISLSLGIWWCPRCRSRTKESQFVSQSTWKTWHATTLCRTDDQHKIAGRVDDSHVYVLWYEDNTWYAYGLTFELFTLLPAGATRWPQLCWNCGRQPFGWRHWTSWMPSSGTTHVLQCVMIYGWVGHFVCPDHGNCCFLVRWCSWSSGNCCCYLN